MIDDADLGDVFGIELESESAAEDSGSKVAAAEPEVVVKAQRRVSSQKAAKKQTAKKAKTVVEKTTRARTAKMKK